MPREKRPLATRVGHRLAAARKKLKLQQTEVAVQLGVTPEAYRSYEGGWNTIPLEVLLRTPKVFGLPIYHFLGLPDPAELAEDERHLVEVYRPIRNPDIRRFIQDMVHRQAEVDAQLQDVEAERP